MVPHRPGVIYRTARRGLKRPERASFRDRQLGREQEEADFEGGSRTDRLGSKSRCSLREKREAPDFRGACQLYGHYPQFIDVRIA